MPGFCWDFGGCAAKPEIHGVKSWIYYTPRVFNEFTRDFFYCKGVVKLSARKSSISDVY